MRGATVSSRRSPPEESSGQECGPVNGPGAIGTAGIARGTVPGATPLKDGGWHAIQFVPVRLLLRTPLPHLLAPAKPPPLAEPAAAERGLLLLRMLGLAVP